MRRIEHRVAGADSNPTSCSPRSSPRAHRHRGKLEPGAPLVNDLHTAEHVPLPNNWDYALELFDGSQLSPIAWAPLQGALSRLQNQSWPSSTRITDVEYDAFIKTV
jgi:glutamine synthetase